MQRTKRPSYLKYDAPGRLRALLAHPLARKQIGGVGEAIRRSTKYDAPWLRRAPLAHPLIRKEIGRGNSSQPRIRRVMASGAFRAAQLSGQRRSCEPGAVEQPWVAPPSVGAQWKLAFTMSGL